MDIFYTFIVYLCSITYVEDSLEGLPGCGVPPVVTPPYFRWIHDVSVRQEVHGVEHVLAGRHPQVVRRQQEAPPVSLRADQNHNYNAEETVCL